MTPDITKSDKYPGAFVASIDTGSLTVRLDQDGNLDIFQYENGVRHGLIAGIDVHALKSLIATLEKVGIE